MKKTKIISMVLALGMMLLNLPMLASANDDAMIFQAEFNGTDDDTEWGWTNHEGKYNGYAYPGTIANGLLNIPQNANQVKKWSAFLGENIQSGGGVKGEGHQVSGKSNIVLKTSFRANELQNGGEIMYVMGRHTAGTADGNIIKVYSTNGNLSYQGTDNVTNSGYTLNTDRFYDLTIKLDFVQQKATINIDDRQGSEGTFATKFFGVPNRTYETISRLIAGATYTTGNYDFDYIRLYDNSNSVTSTSIKDGDYNVSVAEDFIINFAKDVSVESLNNIIVKDSEGNDVPYQAEPNGSDTKSGKLFFNAGLKFDENYTITVPQTVTSTEGEGVSEKTIAFSTEKPIFQAAVEKIDILSATNQARAEISVTNNGENPKDIHVITLVYDSEGKIIKMADHTIRVEAPFSGTLYATTEEIGENAASAKAYVWDGVRLAAE